MSSPSSHRQNTLAGISKHTTSTAAEKRAARTMRTREAASRNRVERRAKMSRLSSVNERLTRQSLELQRENRKLQNDVSLMLALKADPILLRRVLRRLNANTNTTNSNNKKQ